MNSMEDIKTASPFPIGEENTGYAEYFIGKSYLAGLTAEQVLIANVTFEPGCRSGMVHFHSRW